MNATLTQPLTIPVTHNWGASDPAGLYFVGAITTPPGANPLAPSAERTVNIKSFVFAGSP